MDETLTDVIICCLFYVSLAVPCIFYHFMSVPCIFYHFLSVPCIFYHFLSVPCIVSIFLCSSDLYCPPPLPGIFTYLHIKAIFSVSLDEFLVFTYIQYIIYIYNTNIFTCICIQYTMYIK